MKEVFHRALDILPAVRQTLYGDSVAPWIYSERSNAHCACEKKWFIRFNEFNSYATLLTGERVKIQGIGEVLLELGKATSGRASTVNNDDHNIFLRNVLYCPSLPYNIMAGRPMTIKRVATPLERPSDPTRIFYRAQMQFVRLGGLYALELRSFYGTSPIRRRDVGDKPFIRVTWPAVEQMRWYLNGETGAEEAMYVLEELGPPHLIVIGH